jgi:signal transduction histidine kinase/DNA-binding response OmpR family regulator
MRFAPTPETLNRRVVALTGALFGCLLLAALAPYLPPFWHHAMELVLLALLPLLGLVGWYVLEALKSNRHAQATLLAQVAEADQAKTDFLANMSHEIRTPLNGILGMLELFGQMNLNERQTEYVATIRKSSEQLLLILNDVLDVAKIEAGQLSLEHVPFDAASCVNDVAETFVTMARQKGVDVIIQHDPTHPCRVVGDPARFRQIITNLLGNAVKFTEHGYIHVNFQQTNEATAEGRANFSLDVTDTGIGMTETQQQSLFNRFAQAEAGTTRKYGGTGLGLAICRELSRLMGGEIGVQSTLGQGSTFQVKFTLELDPTPLPEGRVVLPPLAGLKHRRVLVVDDQPLNRRIIKEILGSVGMLVTEVENAAAALHAVQTQPFSAALIDNQLPDSNGLLLGKELHRLRPAMHMILHTSLGQRGDAKRFEEVGFEGYLLKPHLPHELLDMLRVVLGRATDKNPLFEGLITRHSLRELREYGRRENRTELLAENRYGRVLVVEDDPVNQQVILALLKQLGAEGLLANNGQEGLQMATRATPETPFALVLMDMNMPIMNGPASASAIRAFEMEEGRLPVPIVALTANAMKEHRTQCLEAGMSDYLTKPVSLDKLKQLLEKWTSSQAADLSADLPTPIASDDAVSVPIDAGVVVNTSLFETLTGGDMATSQRLLELFMENTSQSLETLSEAEFGSEDWRKTAHRLKGSAASLGLFGLSDLAAQAEDVPTGSHKEELLSAMSVAFEDIRTFAARYGV